MKRLAVFVLALVAAGCGGAREHGTATLWVTRDRGSQVLYSGSVPAGLTAIQALERRLKVTTRYGGRFVQSIAGLSGSAGGQRDWFYFVDGVESERGAAEVRLRPGDVEWWDYRSWHGAGISVPVVVGAFPEPFKHGFEWAKPGARVVGAGSVAHRIQRLVGRGPNLIVVDPHVAAGSARSTRTGGIVRLVLGTRAAARLAADPSVFRYRYEVGA
ncbi:MAG TPA: DUF4430 domain-containing protein [Gaiellaceae bacterium]|nr:DUF4430 domain-containing protein [Gaiellaceae bacterium]